MATTKAAPKSEAKAAPKAKAAASKAKALKDALNEALRDWIANPVDTHYIIGSVVGPCPYPDMVARFQSIISLETKKQLKEHTGNELPQYVMACVGGGSNAMGMFYHFLEDENVKLVAVEAAGKGVESGYSAATTFLGREGVLHGSRSVHHAQHREAAGFQEPPGPNAAPAKVHSTIVPPYLSAKNGYARDRLAPSGAPPRQSQRTAKRR